MEKVDIENLPCCRASYALMDGIDTSDKFIDARKQIQMVNLFSAFQNDALNALMKLQSCGVTNEEILIIYEFMNEARQKNTRKIQFEGGIK